MLTSYWDNHPHEYYNKDTCNKCNLVHWIWSWCPAYRSTCLKCQHSSHWVVCFHSRTSSSSKLYTDTDFEEAEHICNHPQRTEEKVMTMPEDNIPLPENHIPSPLAPWTLTTMKWTCLWHKNSEKHSLQDHHLQKPIGNNCSCTIYTAYKTSTCEHL